MSFVRACNHALVKIRDRMQTETLIFPISTFSYKKNIIHCEKSMKITICKKEKIRSISQIVKDSIECVERLSSQSAPNYPIIGLQFPFPCQCPLFGYVFCEPMMNIFPEHDLLYVSLEECREVAAVAEVALVAVLLQHQTSRECLKGFENYCKPVFVLVKIQF